MKNSHVGQEITNKHTLNIQDLNGLNTFLPSKLYIIIFQYHCRVKVRVYTCTPSINLQSILPENVREIYHLEIPFIYQLPTKFLVDMATVLLKYF